MIFKNKKALLIVSLIINIVLILGYSNQQIKIENLKQKEINITRELYQANSLILNKTLYSLEKEIKNNFYSSTEMKYTMYKSGLYLQYCNQVFDSMEELNPNINMNILLLSDYLISLGYEFPISEKQSKELLSIIENKLYTDSEALYKEKTLNGYPIVNDNFNKQIHKINNSIKKTKWYYDMDNSIRD